MEDKEINIRHASSSELGMINAMQKEWEQEQSVWGYRANTLDELQKKSLDMMWIFEICGNIIGYAICHPAPIEERCIADPNERIFEIEDIYIQSQYRKQGYGSEFIKVIETWARNNNYQKLLVYSSVKDMKKILSFYEQQGFMIWNLEMFKSLK